jgi:3-dehydroquinate synthase
MDQAVHGFSVPFRFPVFFTRNAWRPDNHAFVNAIRRLELDRPHRVLVVIDSNVASANPGLTSEIDRYFAAH